MYKELGGRGKGRGRGRIVVGRRARFTSSV